MSTRRKKKQHKQRRRADWQKIIHQWQKSGLSVRAFCGRHGISETSFYQGRRRLGVSVPASRRKNSHDQFVEVNLPPLSSFPTRLEIIWAQPPVVKVYGGCEEKLLEQTLRLLKEQVC